MPAVGSITSALQRLGKGEQFAINDLEQALRPQVRKLIGYVRNRKFNPMTDATGVVNLGLNHLLLGILDGKFPNLKDSAGASRLFRKIVCNVLFEEERKLGRKKRMPPGNRHERLDIDIEDKSTREIGFAVEFLEEFELRFLEKLSDQELRILEKRLEGLSNNDIASEVGISARYVQILLETMQKRWNDL